MAINFHDFMRTLTQMVDHHDPKPPRNPVLDLAQLFTGDYGFVDDQTQKSHQLSISPELDIRIDGRSLPGQVTGITTDQLTFLDHFGYQLIVTSGATGPESVYDEAEDATYTITATVTDEADLLVADEID